MLFLRVFFPVLSFSHIRFRCSAAFASHYDFTSSLLPYPPGTLFTPVIAKLRAVCAFRLGLHRECRLYSWRVWCRSFSVLLLREFHAVSPSCISEDMSCVKITLKIYMEFCTTSKQNDVDIRWLSVHCTRRYGGFPNLIRSGCCS